MKFTLLTLALAALSSAASDYENSIACAAKNADINTAIQTFCAKGDIMAPSDYAHKGAKLNGIVVRLGGHCSPAQWVPSVWCTSQFHEVCANNPQGLGRMNFGRDGCQWYHIGNTIKKTKPSPDGEIGQ